MTVDYRMETYTAAEWFEFYVSDCAACGTAFAMPKAMERRRRDDGRSFYCPNGHSMEFRENQLDKARREAKRLGERLTAERARRDRAEAEAAHQRNVANGHKGAHQRTKNRVAKGVCPWCDRSFVDLASHVAGQHPDCGET